MEKTINRMALVLIPREQCSNWLKIQLGEFYKADICKVFLLDVDDNFTIHQIPELIKKYYNRMFVDMLDGFTNKKSSWPELTYATFTEWFEIRNDGFVADLGETDINGEKY